MKIKISYSMGYAGTDTQWEEEIPQDVVDAGEEAIDEYIENMHEAVWQEATEKISTYVNIVE